MNKTDKIKFLKKQLATAKELKAVAEGNYNLAARLESEAQSELDMLGTNSVRARQGLSPELQLKIQAQLTA